MPPLKDPKNAVIIINPVSGTTNAKDKHKTITSLAGSHGWQGTIRETTPKQSATQIITTYLKSGHNHFVVCGGDGTVAEAVAALTNKQAVLGVVPSGTGNLFALNLNLPIQLEQAVKVALIGRPFAIDIGIANGRYFSIMVGMGLDANMIKDASRQLKDKIGVLAYVAALFKNLSRPSLRYSIALDHQSPISYRAKSVMMANLGQISGGLEVVPETDPQSGFLRVGIVQAKGITSWLAVLFYGLLGRVHHSSNYTLLKAKHIKVLCVGQPQPFECDGDLFPATKELEVEILPKALWVLH